MVPYVSMILYIIYNEKKKNIVYNNIIYDIYI